MKEFVLVIPARYQSSRLPGKPLIDINGKSLIFRTYEQCLNAVNRDKIYVATDDVRIYEHCIKNNIQVEMTSSNCLTGTDRIAEFAQKIKSKCYINVQGDEPLMNPNDIIKVIKTSQLHPDDIINGYALIKDREEYISLSIPKVVFRPDGRLLYMSRNPIPGNKTGEFVKSWRQICVYAFPYETLINFAKTNKKLPLEQQEDIEILRFLELGYEVRMIELSGNSIAVDIPEDVRRVKIELKKIDND